MKLDEFINEFRILANSQQELKTFVFDDISAINEKRTATFPLMLLNPPDSVIPVFNRSIKEDNYSIDFFIFGLFFQDDTRSLEKVWSDLNDIGIQFLVKFLENSNKFKLTTQIITKTLGHREHTDNLVGVRFQFELLVPFDCETGTFL